MYACLDSLHGLSCPSSNSRPSFSVSATQTYIGSFQVRTVTVVSGKSIISPDRTTEFAKILAVVVNLLGSTDTGFSSNLFIKKIGESPVTAFRNWRLKLASLSCNSLISSRNMGCPPSLKRSLFIFVYGYGIAAASRFVHIDDADNFSQVAALVPVIFCIKGSGQETGYVYHKVWLAWHFAVHP